jgi:hypothetical protein
MLNGMWTSFERRLNWLADWLTVADPIVHSVRSDALVEGDEMISMGDSLTPERMEEIALKYGVETDFPATMPIVERHGLSM